MGHMQRRVSRLRQRMELAIKTLRPICEEPHAAEVITLLRSGLETDDVLSIDQQRDEAESPELAGVQ